MTLGPSAPLQASAFYAESCRAREVWTVQDATGFLVPEDGRGKRAMPFWSSRARLDEVLRQVSGFRGCQATAVPLADWRAQWLTGMARDGLLVGLNWSGSAVSGFAVTPSDVETNLVARGL